MTSLRFEGIDLESGETIGWGLDDGMLTGTARPDAVRLPGRFVLAGLVDAHAHLGIDFTSAQRPLGDPSIVADALRSQLEAGVLLARDVGAPIGVRVGGDHDDGPHVLAAGRFLAPPGGYLPGLFEGISAEDLAEVAVAELDANGGGWVKLVFDFPEHFSGFQDMPWSTPNYPDDIIAGLCAAVHAAGARVAAHVTGNGDAAMAIELGVDSLEHGHDVSLDSLTALGARGGAWTPTLLTVWRDALSHAPFADHQRGHYREALTEAGRAGVTVLAGTDSGGAGTIAEEIALLADLGMAPRDALAAGSWAARAYLGRPGLIAGEPADLVTYDDDPRDDPDVLKRPAAIVRKGRRIR